MTYSIDDKMEDELYAEVLEKIELFQKEHIRGTLQNNFRRTSYYEERRLRP